MANIKRRRFRRVLVDVDTQVDLIFGELPRWFPSRVSNNGSSDHSLDELLQRFRRLIAWARVRDVPVVSTALTQRSDLLDSEGTIARVCYEGAPGQMKIRFTTLPSRITFGPENRLDLPRHILADYQQIIFEKRVYDPFTQPRADRLLTEMKADEFIVFGMGLEWGIKSMVLGLLGRRKTVTLVRDAVAGCRPDSATMALRQMEAKGARFVDTYRVTGASRLCSTGAMNRNAYRPLAQIRVD
jgi:nicotinamidase-related amidase